MRLNRTHIRDTAKANGWTLRTDDGPADSFSRNTYVLTVIYTLDAIQRAYEIRDGGIYRELTRDDPDKRPTVTDWLT